MAEAEKAALEVRRQKLTNEHTHLLEKKEQLEMDLQTVKQDIIGTEIALNDTVEVQAHQLDLCIDRIKQKEENIIRALRDIQSVTEVPTTSLIDNDYEPQTIPMKEEQSLINTDGQSLKSTTDVEDTWDMKNDDDDKLLKLTNNVDCLLE
eukprot:GHVO01033266.1.p1 GENE.GHVO01033266.1~~GHVO01033266.1.p1  ORF type:complete len:150 (-),score=35.95 GHVO01033266.1:49-498(-)